MSWRHSVVPPKCKCVCVCAGVCVCVFGGRSNRQGRGDSIEDVFKIFDAYKPQVHHCKWICRPGPDGHGGSKKSLLGLDIQGPAYQNTVPYIYMYIYISTALCIS